MKIIKVIAILTLINVLFGSIVYANEGKKLDQIASSAYRKAEPPHNDGRRPASSREKSIKLSLYETLSLAMQNNFDVQLNIYDRLIKDTELDLAGSVFDTSLTITGDYEYDKSKKPSIIFGQAAHTGSANAALTKKLITGTDLSFSFENTRESTDSAFATLNPYYESVMEMRFTQPLLRNIFGMNDWGDVRLTRIDVNNFNLTALDKIEGNVADVEKAYWDAVIAEDLVEIGRDMYDRALNFYQINKTKRKIGTSEATDLLSAEANLESRKTELAVEEDIYKSAINNLKFQINHPDTDADIIPADSVEFTARRVDFYDSLKSAFKNRRDYRRARDDVRAKKLKFNMARNERWPQLDFEGSMRLNGLGPVYKDSAAKAFTDENPVYRAAVTFTLPFEDSAGRSEYNKSKSEKAKALVTLKKVEKTIVTEIDDAARALNLARETAEQRIKIEELQRMKLEAEEKQFKIGRSDSDRIVRFQEDLLTAKILAARALRRYKDALIDLYVTENTYLNRRELTLQ